MQMHKLVQRTLSETEEKTIEHFQYYFNNKKSFALIGSDVVAVLPDEHSDNLEELKQEISNQMSNLINTPPDFTTYVMDDKFGVVEMNYGIYAVSSEPLSDEELASVKVNLSTALVIRGLCLDSCEAGQILAIIIA